MQTTPIRILLAAVARTEAIKATIPSKKTQSPTVQKGISHVILYCDFLLIMAELTPNITITAKPIKTVPDAYQPFKKPNMSNSKHT